MPDLRHADVRRGRSSRRDEERARRGVAFRALKRTATLGQWLRHEELMCPGRRRPLHPPSMPNFLHCTSARDTEKV